MKKNFYDMLKSDAPVVMDGAMGTVLFALRSYRGRESRA